MNPISRNPGSAPAFGKREENNLHISSCKCETKLFHFRGKLKKDEIKSAKRPPHTPFLHMNPIYKNPGSAPAFGKREENHLHFSNSKWLKILHFNDPFLYMRISSHMRKDDLQRYKRSYIAALIV